MIKNRFNLSLVMSATELCANLIKSSRDIEEWCEWVNYLLETLQGGIDAEEYAVFLEDLRDDITGRLKEGRW
jgi:hypothetical protein